MRTQGACNSWTTSAFAVFLKAGATLQFWPIAISLVLFEFEFGCFSAPASTAADVEGYSSRLYKSMYIHVQVLIHIHKIYIYISIDVYL